MLRRFFKKYFVVIFVIATFMGVFHHHNDFKQHLDCKIHLLKTNLAAIDTPVEVTYLTQLSVVSDAVIMPLFNLHSDLLQKSLHAREPPKIS